MFIVSAYLLWRKNVIKKQGRGFKRQKTHGHLQKKPVQIKVEFHLLVNNRILFKLSLRKNRKIFQIEGGFKRYYAYLIDLRIWPKT